MKSKLYFVEIIACLALALSACMPASLPATTSRQPVPAPSASSEPAAPASTATLEPAAAPPTATSEPATASQPAATLGVEEQIQNAMSAAPVAIAHDAAIMDYPPDGQTEFVELRKGSNGWTCLPDWLATPGNDPECIDATWMAWTEALIAGTEPNVTAPGIAYMLAGGSDASNTDPFAMEPAPGEDWLTSPPHVMILVPEDLDPAVFSTDPDSGGPYVMFEGTPYEHLMVPVVAILESDTGSADETSRNAMSAAPLAIAKDATLIGWPATEGGDMVVLRQGTNDWACVADWPATPGNDPQCNDPVWTVWSDAFAAGKEPEITAPGIAYMLVGGSDPSNTDPMAMEPAPGEDWVTTPPHIMLLLPGGFDTGQFTTDHTSGFPYIMFEGTPYEHLMIPVMDMPH